MCAAAFPLSPFPAGFPLLCHGQPWAWRVLGLRGGKCHSAVTLSGAGWCGVGCWMERHSTVAKVRTFHLTANLFARFLPHPCPLSLCSRASACAPAVLLMVEWGGSWVTLSWVWLRDKRGTGVRCPGCGFPGKGSMEVTLSWVWLRGCGECGGALPWVWRGCVGSGGVRWPIRSAWAER